MSEDAARRPVEQRVLVTPASRLAARLGPLVREGFEPARITLALAGAAPDDEVEIALVLERRPAGVDAASARQLVGPLPFLGGDGRSFLVHAPRPHDRGHVVSVAVAGTAADEQGRGLLAAFVWSPDRGARTVWGVHLHAVRGEAFTHDPTVRVLAEQGRLVSTQPVAMPDGEGTLSLWHEAPAEPAPTPSGVATAASSRGAPTTEADPIAGWLRSHMEILGARRAQVVVVREGVVTYARSIDGAGVHVPPQPMRIGSVSKVLLGLATAGALRRAGLPGGFDTPLLTLLEALPGTVRASTWLRRVTIGQLLTHSAGLPTAPEIVADDPRHPLAEARLARDLGRPGPLGPGDLLRWFTEVGDDAIFVRPPGTGRPDYGNEGAILLGEALATFTRGEPAGFGDVLARMFRAVGLEVGTQVGARGVLFGAGLAASRARGEVPPRPTSLSWVQARFDADRGVVPSPFGDNGPYLGAAAGVSVPIPWIGQLIAAIGKPSEDPWAPTRWDLEQLLTPCPLDVRYGHGVMLGRPAYWTFRSPSGGVARTIRVRPAHHHGRIDGGSALHLHLVPIDPEEGPGLAVTVAFDRLGPLTAEVEGQQLLALLRAQEGTPGWGEPADLPGRARS